MKEGLRLVSTLYNLRVMIANQNVKANQIRNKKMNTDYKDVVLKRTDDNLFKMESLLFTPNGFQINSNFKMTICK